VSAVYTEAACKRNFIYNRAQMRFNMKLRRPAVKIGFNRVWMRFTTEPRLNASILRWVFTWETQRAMVEILRAIYSAEVVGRYSFL
jgi:hypothetical protein